MYNTTYGLNSRFLSSMGRTEPLRDKAQTQQMGYIFIWTSMSIFLELTKYLGTSTPYFAGSVSTLEVVCPL